MILDKDNQNRQMFSLSSQGLHQQNDENDCILCVHSSSQLILWLRQNQYCKQNNFQVKHMRVANHILSKQRASAYINYKEAVIRSTSQMGLDSLEYKDWGKIVNEIKNSILRNLQMNKGRGYDKMYIHSEIMLKNQIKKKILTTRKSQGKYNFQMINPMNTQRSNRMPSGYAQKILLNEQLRTCYNFYPLDQQHKSKRKTSNQNNIHQSLSQSQIQMQRLKSQLSIMINQMKQLNESSYQKNIDFSKPFLDYNKLKEEIKFRTKLAVNYSDIIQIDSKNNEHKRKEKIKYQVQNYSKGSHIETNKIINENHRMYTSPDLGKNNNSYIQNKYAEMYGYLLNRESSEKGVSKGKDKKGDKKVNYNNVKPGINSINGNHNKNSRQLTNQLGTSSTTVFGGNLTNRKSKSKSKLKVKPSLSSTANTFTVHISSPRSHNNNNMMHMDHNNIMNVNNNNMKRLTEVKSVSRGKLGNGSKSVGKSTTKRGVQKQKI